MVRGECLKKYQIGNKKLKNIFFFKFFNIGIQNTIHTLHTLHAFFYWFFKIYFKMIIEVNNID